MKKEKALETLKNLQMNALSENYQDALSVAVKEIEKSINSNRYYKELGLEIVILAGMFSILAICFSIVWNVFWKMIASLTLQYFILGSLATIAVLCIIYFISSKKKVRR